MSILDTNVLSELVKPAPDTNVVHWIGQKPVASLFTSTITRSREGRLATRNVSDFESCGIAVINPWVEPAL